MKTTHNKTTTKHTQKHKQQTHIHKNQQTYEYKTKTTKKN